MSFEASGSMAAVRSHQAVVNITRAMLNSEILIYRLEWIRAGQLSR